MSSTQPGGQFLGARTPGRVAVKMIVLHALPSILAETITQPFYVCGEAHLAYAQFLPACSLLAYLLLVFAPLRSTGAQNFLLHIVFHNSHKM